MTSIGSKPILAALVVGLMDPGGAANAAMALMDESRTISAEVGVFDNLAGRDRESASTSSLGDFSDFDEFVEADVTLGLGSATGAAQQTSQIGTASISASGASTATIEVSGPSELASTTFADAHADTHFLVDFEVTTPQVFNLSGAVSSFATGEFVAGGYATVSLRSQDGAFNFSVENFSRDQTIPFVQSGTLLPNIYTLSADASSSSNAAFATIETGRADFYVEFTAVPVPAPVWLFSTGLLGLMGVSRRNGSA
jgi:hypothetical protein